MLRIRSLGTVPYHEAYVLQHALAAGAGDDYLLLLEHPHTYTLGAHADERHVLVDPALVGATLERTDRGGDVTYHGPGQLVVYPVVTLDPGPGSAPDHAHRLEQVVIDALGDLGVVAGRQPGYPGIWLGRGASSPARSPPSASAPCARPMAASGRCTAWPSTSSATWRCGPTSCRAGSASTR